MRTSGKFLICSLFLCAGNALAADEPARKKAALAQIAPEESASHSTETQAAKAPAAPVEASGFVDALVNGKVKALLRYSGQYRNSNLHVLQDSSTPDISDEKKQQYTAIGGFAGFETLPWFHTSMGATFYTSVPFGNNPDDRRGLGGLYEEDGGQDAYAVLGATD